MSRVAVWLTNYNSEQFIAAAIESVLQQTHKDLVLFIADNNSTDAAPDIIGRYCMSDVRVRTIEVKAGIKGIPMMRGVWEYIRKLEGCDYAITIGGHDVWESVDHLATLVERAEVHKDAAIVYSDTWQIDFENKICSHYKDIHQFDTAVPHILTPQNVICTVSSPQLFGLWRHSVMRQIPLRHCCSGWDHLIVAEASTHGAILFEGRVKLFMRRPPYDDDLTKYGERHLDKETLSSGAVDFHRQLEWMLHNIDRALLNVPESARPLYKMLSVSSMIASYITLRGMNLYIVPGAMDSFNSHPCVQQIFSGARHMSDQLQLLCAAARVEALK